MKKVYKKLREKNDFITIACFLSSIEIFWTIYEIDF